ncbi:hypothetical protein Taro_018607, partial [Colocasia esculenta]|nr:hypothetical protein [Colocasia esculenta]
MEVGEPDVEDPVTAVSLLFKEVSITAEAEGSDLEDLGRVEELLVAEELWNDHKKLIFFPFLFAATCTNRPLEIDQRVISMGRVKKLFVAEELWSDHKKLIFFPFSSAATCTNHPLEIDQ